MKIGLIGATGLVGSVMLKVLEERDFGEQELFPAASNRSIGEKIVFNGKERSLFSVDDVMNASQDNALFAVG